MEEGQAAQRVWASVSQLSNNFSLFRPTFIEETLSLFQV